MKAGRQRPAAFPADRPQGRPTASRHSAKHCMPDYFTWIPKPEPNRTQKNNEKYREKIGSYLKFFLSLHTEKESGRSSVRLEYTSGGRVVAGSNPVTPTDERLDNQKIVKPFSSAPYSRKNSGGIPMIAIREPRSRPSGIRLPRLPQRNFGKGSM